MKKAGWLAARLREIGLTRAEACATSPRHAALRDDPAALALRLFRDGGALDREEELRLFGGDGGPEEILYREAEQVRARYRLDLVEHLYLFSDWRTGDPGEVLAPGETTAILYRAARVRSAGNALDLGCGSGTLALLLAPTCQRVTGIDINPRAIALARMNAVVNGVGNAEFRQGKLLAPVKGERFDLIVCQPPYVPLTAGDVWHVFLHGGPRGDELARTILASLRCHLEPSGRALVFSDWPLQAGESLQERIPTRGWKARLLASPPLTVKSYAESYGPELAAHFEKMGIVGVRQCLAILEPGESVEEIEVLPQEWAHIDRLA